MILNNTRYRRKICVFCSILTAVLIALCFRLFYLMIVKGDYYSKKASALQERERDIAGIRGDIVDRNERIIATNETAYNISVIHNQITDKEAVISVLSSELSIDEKTIRSKVDKVTSIEKIKNNVSKKTGDKILSYGLAGVKVDESSVRYYPLNELFSKVIGFAGADGQGVVGLETTYDEILRGTPGRIYTVCDGRGVDDVADAAIVVISAGAGQKPGETRLDLVNKNVAIFKSIIPEIAKRNFAGIMLVVANPVDILTQVAIKLSGLPENRVIGSGTVLDSARLRYKLGEHLSVDSRSVHAFIVGEHGDSEVVAWSSANVSGVPLSEMCEMRGHYKHKENTAEIATAVKNSAYEIINKKHATYYGIAMSVKRICEVIMRDEKSILPVSHMIHGVYDIDGVSLSMPAIVGADGIESDIPINLSGEEALKLKESADSLKKIMETIEL